MNHNKNIVVEAICVGLVVVIVGTLIKKYLPNTCFDKYIKKEYLSLFLIGMFSHFVFELAGIKRWIV